MVDRQESFQSAATRLAPLSEASHKDADLLALLPALLGSLLPGYTVELWPTSDSTWTLVVARESEGGVRLGLFSQQKLRGVDVPVVLAMLRSRKAYFGEAWKESDVFVALSTSATPHVRSRLFAHGVELYDLKDLQTSAERRGLCPVLSSLLRHDEQATPGEILTNSLDGIHPGRHKEDKVFEWRRYEDLCRDVIEYLFTPPLSNLETQPSTGPTSRRPDIIMENGADSGFWRLMRERCQSFEVVFDMKNYAGEISHEVLLGFREYLGESRAGRFGILLTRKGASKGATVKQHAYWHQERLLILIVDDNDVKQMLADKDRGVDPALVLKRLYLKVVHER